MYLFLYHLISNALKPTCYVWRVRCMVDAFVPSLAHTHRHTHTHKHARIWQKWQTNGCTTGLVNLRILLPRGIQKFRKNWILEGDTLALQRRHKHNSAIALIECNVSIYPECGNNASNEMLQRYHGKHLSKENSEVYHVWILNSAKYALSWVPVLCLLLLRYTAVCVLKLILMKQGITFCRPKK